MTNTVKVIIMSRCYQMSRKALNGLLETARQKIPFGVYAVEKGGNFELRNDICSSVTQLKKLKRDYKAQGFKVYANDG